MYLSHPHDHNSVFKITRMNNLHLLYCQVRGVAPMFYPVPHSSAEGWEMGTENYRLANTSSKLSRVKNSHVHDAQRPLFASNICLVSP